jgi:hypothetical protein
MPNRGVRVTVPPHWQFFAPAELGDLLRTSQEKHFEKRTSSVLQATIVARMRSLAKKKRRRYRLNTYELLNKAYYYYC